MIKKGIIGVLLIFLCLSSFSFSRRKEFLYINNMTEEKLYLEFCFLHNKDEKTWHQNINESLISITNENNGKPINRIKTNLILSYFPAYGIVEGHDHFQKIAGTSILDKIKQIYSVFRIIGIDGKEIVSLSELKEEDFVSEEIAGGICYYLIIKENSNEPVNSPL